MIGEIPQCIIQRAKNGVVILDQVAYGPDKDSIVRPPSKVEISSPLIQSVQHGIAIIQLFGQKNRQPNGRIFHTTDVVLPDTKHSIQLSGTLPHAEDGDFNFELETSRFVDEGRRFTHTNMQGHMSDGKVSWGDVPLTINEEPVETELHRASIRDIVIYAARALDR